MANRSGLILYESLRETLAKGYTPPQHQEGCKCPFEAVDIITGGYPCQPFSLAGKRKGEADRRNLWPYLWILLCHFRPSFILLENVPGHLSMGFGRVLGDLALLGYDAEWEVLSAAGVGAPHLRRRVFIVAHTSSSHDRQPTAREMQGKIPKYRNSSIQADMANPLLDKNQRNDESRFLNEFTGGGEAMANSTEAQLHETVKRNTSARRSPRRSSGGSWWATEPDVGRVAYGIPSRVDRLRCLGNAVVP